MSLAAYHRREVQRRRHTEQEENRRPMADWINLAGTPAARMEALLGPRGTLLKALGWKHRPGQQSMAAACLEAFEGRQVAAIEAPCGVGKSGAYLTAAASYGGRVVVSTATLLLQDQLLQKDLPAMARHLGLHVDYCALKGRANYACAERVLEAEWPAWERLRGDVGHLAPERAREVVVQDHECKASRCPSYAECWLYRARARAREARIVVTNHALLALELRHGLGLFGDWQALVVDEAHGFAEAVRGTLESTLSLRRVRSLTNAAADVGASAVTVEAVEEAAKAFLGVVARQGGGRLREVPEALLVPAGRLREAVDALGVALSERVIKDPEAGAGVVVTSVAALGADLRALADDTDDVRWVEAEPGKPVALRCSPVDVAGHLQETLWRLGRPVVLTSATLCSAPGDFGHFLRQMGLEVEP